MSKQVRKKSVSQEIHEKIRRFCKENERLLKCVSLFRKTNTEHISFIYERPSRINMYLSNVNIMIITANEIERDTLFSYFLETSEHHIVQIAKRNLVYSFFKIKDNKVVHIEPASIGAYAHGGSASAISEALDVVKPSIVISLGVAFGANYEKHEIGDVLVGRQHFSYDKATKISDGNLNIKKLHVEEPDDYMMGRFKATVQTEEKILGKFNNLFQVVLGNMVTGEFVVDSADIREMIFSPFQPFGIIGGEMEAYGIFEEIKKATETHCILIKGICDWGAGKNSRISGDSDNVQTITRNEIETSYNPKNALQTLAMLNACKVCETFLVSKEIFSDLHIKGASKRFWRFFKIIKYRIVKEKF